MIGAARCGGNYLGIKRLLVNHERPSAHCGMRLSLLSAGKQSGTATVLWTAGCVDAAQKFQKQVAQGEHVVHLEGAPNC